MARMIPPRGAANRSFPCAVSFQVAAAFAGSSVETNSFACLTLASSSLAQNPGNLLYLNLPMPRTARVTIGPAQLTLPILRKTVSR